MQPLKLDLLDYITQDFDPDREHGITFIPLNINYERVVEDQGLNMNQDEHEIRKPGTPFVLKFAFEFLSKSMPELAYRRRRRFGRACAKFGAPISLRSWITDRKINFRQLERTERFGHVAPSANKFMGDVDID